MSTPGAAWQRRDIGETFVRDRRHLIPLIEGGVVAIAITLLLLPLLKSIGRRAQPLPT